MLVVRWLIFLALAACAMPVQAAGAAVPAIMLIPGEDAGPVAPFIRYVKDSGGVAPGKVAALAALPQTQIMGSTIHFGPPGARTVVFLRVRNVGSDQGSWIFTTGRGSLKYFRLYEQGRDGLALKVDGDDARAASENLRTYQAFSSELVLRPREEKLLLIDFVSENSTYMPIRIETYGSFFKDRRANIAMVSGVVLGVLVLVLLNFLFFSITGHREFVWLAVAEVFLALNTVHSEGYITIFFLADSPLTGLAVEDIFKCGFAAAMAQFSRSFIDTKRHFPRRDRILRILIGSAVVIMAMQPGLALYPPGLRQLLHGGGWLVAVGVALFLPFVGFAAMRQLGRQLWPLFVGWGSLALFIVYSAVASMGFFTWLPINWHLAGPMGLFESIMVTLALGLNLKKIQDDKLAADSNYARSMAERLEISERAARLAQEKAFALETVNSQNALLHASGHDSKQVILALNTAIDVLKRRDTGSHDELTGMLQSSATYLSEIVSTTMSGANIVGDDNNFVAISAFDARALVEPLQMMFKAAFGRKALRLETRVEGEVMLVSDRPLLMRVLANLLSNCYNHTERGGAFVGVERHGERAVIRISDTGKGMPRAIMDALNGEGAARLRADDDTHGTGSGFRSARQLVASLAGSLRVVTSGAGGTEIRLDLPSAFASVTPCSVDELQAELGGWNLVDFDQRAAFDAALAAARPAPDRIVAITYDDTTVTRGRLSEQVAMMVIKPPCRELARHPLLAALSEQV